ncbi:MAG: flagellar protein FlbD [Thermoanaerobacterium sp.]|uniref:Flagellar protein FlbD n=1 Tax=Thermoanaerobacterium butyriciformans TaxID=1702242 RepID=A0ABS4NGV9_9THEO|nr:flagellar FlbD family protein [Thermoanaerobacterium sp. CMT5567-10]MBP2072902.1 flagellar protein FlbD [Thermoanaerobacterium butyriciformans]MDI3477049.1 flagellar protein FlbD [Thermoanaerobacterium sp.]TCW38683.1 flagellar protein FlbD [Thermohydrogenium kirishiense]WHE08168.1 flagellar FlbD family protein [Thermoanaerobacterium thermosaccharolyticum]MDK2805416.1 flagellar protein FlbD [Thermoanaerobacterium sp.]
MINVTKLNGDEFTVNADMIEFIEETPDTVISLISGKKVVVKERKDEIIEKVIDYKRKIFIK